MFCQQEEYNTLLNCDYLPWEALRKTNILVPAAPDLWAPP